LASLVRVSYILATKNRPGQEGHIRRSILELRTSDDEFIIVDGSEEPSVFESYDMNKLPDMVLVGPDTSSAHAYNRGIMEAQGEYIKLVASDDYYDPEGVHRAIDVMDEYKIDVMQCGGKRWYEKDVWGGGSNSPPPYDCVPPGEDYGQHPHDVLKYGATGVGTFYRRDAFARIGLFETRSTVCDIDHMLKAIEVGANVRYCRLYTYEHPITKDSGLGNETKFRVGQRELADLYRHYGYSPNGVKVSKWGTREEARYDGGFS
jgi:glycosyltransferase involved in cell wall biosynthesis